MHRNAFTAILFFVCTKSLTSTVS